MPRKRGTGIPKFDKATSDLFRAAGKLAKAADRGFKPPRRRRSAKAGCTLALCPLLAAPVILWLVIGCGQPKPEIPAPSPTKSVSRQGPALSAPRQYSAPNQPAPTYQQQPTEPVVYVCSTHGVLKGRPLGEDPVYVDKRGAVHCNQCSGLVSPQRTGDMGTQNHTVYVTSTGKRYHTATCQDYHGGQAVSLSEALDRGLRPCNVCTP